MSGKIAKIILSVVGLLMSVIAVILAFTIVVPGFKAQNALNNGTLDVGYLTDVETTGTIINDERVYYIEFMFFNDEGTQITARSKKEYTLEKIRDFGFISINYADNMYQPFYEMEIEIMRLGDIAVLTVESPVNIPVLAVTAIFGLAGVICLTLSALLFAGVLGADRILKKGRSETGSYVDRVGGMVVNGTQYYKVIFTYKGDGRDLCEGKSGSYRYGEADALQYLGKFPIKYLGKKAVIEIDKQTLLKAQSDCVAAQMEAARIAAVQAAASRTNIDPFANSDPFAEDNSNSDTIINKR